MDKEVKSQVVSEIISWTKTVVFAVVFALFINNFVIVNATVPTGSMENTIMTGDRIVAYRLAYLTGKPKRFESVVFRYPDDETQLYVKRIIGLPGEKIVISGGKVYVNGAETPLDDDFIKDAPEGEWGPYEIPEGHYFMMGDNRNYSEDSRLWRNTYLSDKKILGRVIFKYYPGFKLLYDK